MDTASSFSPDYPTARERFRSAARSLGWELSAYPFGLSGPTGEALAVDVAISPASAPLDALVLTSGLHGVEGFFGSALQLEWLETAARERQAAPTVRCVLVHALNPFGFAWRRRVNEDNVDLNRNLLLEGESYQGCPDTYRTLDRLLNPRRPPSLFEPVLPKFMLAIGRYGMPALKQAIAAGQYEYPRGLFYGGDRPSATMRLLTAHLDAWLGTARRIVHLDFHTGLGAWGNGRLLIDYPIEPGQCDWLAHWFGRDSFEVSDASGVAYTARGNFGGWCHARRGERDYLYAAAEFGAYPAPKVLAGLRAENQAHHWGAPGAASTRRAKERLLELFCPRSPQWRNAVLDKGMDLVDRALRGLLGEPLRGAKPSD